MIHGWVSHLLCFTAVSLLKYERHNKAVVVSGLSSSKVSAYSMLIKEFCRGKAGWNDRAVFIETNFS